MRWRCENLDREEGAVRESAKLRISIIAYAASVSCLDEGWRRSISERPKM